jgi:uncharacterized membrane protein YedE/YeeE
MGCAFPEHHSGGGHVPVKAAVIVLAVAAAAGLARGVHPHVPWRLLAIGAAVACSALLALAGWAFSRWERRRELARMRAEEPQGLRWRDGSPIREPMRGGRP